MTRWLIGAMTAFAIALPAHAQNTTPGDHDARRDGWQKVDEIFAAMAIKPGSTVADIGAGGGYFTTRLSKAVGEGGRVYAVDVDGAVLKRLRIRIEEGRISNVETVEGATDDVRLAAASIDAALIVNAYHEMKEHQAMLASIKRALKPGGRLVIVEPVSASRRSAARELQTSNHEIGIDWVKQDAREAGFTQVQLVDPFTTRPEGHGEEWMLVLTPATPAAQAVSAWTATKNEDWASPELRISVADFKKLASRDVLVLDVRDVASYRQGHLPGAILATVEEVATATWTAKLKGERRLVATYCS
jgi:predicted methyltransferase